MQSQVPSVGDISCQKCVSLLNTNQPLLVWEHRLNQHSRDGHALDVAIRKRIVDVYPELKNEAAGTEFRAELGPPNSLLITAFCGDQMDQYLLELLSSSNHGPIVQPDTSRDCALELVRSWLGNCVKMHSDCREDSKFVPTRLINVGNDSQEPFLTIRLPRVHYAALSYCWGSGKGALKTTKDNFMQHQTCISLSALPKTLSDAIKVCRYLGIDYLWVDALCIIQDDVGNKDWHEHSDVMSQIYSNAYLTIAADASPDCAMGFLGQQRFGNSPFYHEFEAGDWVFENNAAVIMKKPPFRREHASSIGGVDGSALSSRGWALQEVISARRIIHFTSDEMIWQCRTTQLCECGFRDPNEHHNINAFSLGALNGHHEAGLFHYWQEIVRRYSSRQLTYEGDKLVAVAGLACQMQESRAVGRYLAGLWESNLTQDLLWYVCPGNICERPSRYTAPSWSWASIRGPVDYFRMHNYCTWRPEVKILTALCEQSSDSQTGPVSNGYLQLTGTLVPVLLELQPARGVSRDWQYYNITAESSRLWTYRALAHTNSILKYEILMDTITEADYDLTVTCRGARADAVCFVSDCTCGVDDVREREHFLLPMGTSYAERFKEARYDRDSVSEIASEFCRVWWLVLRSTCSSGTFQRVGLGYQVKYRDYTAAQLFGVSQEDEVEIRLV